MNKLIAIVDQLRDYIPQYQLVDNTISEASIGWHIEHSCLVIIKITETVKGSDSTKYQHRFNFKKWYVFLTGKFPRGRAKAPASVLPVDNITQESLMDSIARAKNAVIELGDCTKNQYFLHPIFGNLNKTETIPFLAIHTKHHLRIIQDMNH